MPCNSDYMQPNQAESNSRKIADMIVFLSFRLPEDRFDHALEMFNTDYNVIVEASKDQYGNPESLNEFTQILCKLCSDMTQQEQENFIYAGRIPESRRLADWWDEHQKADRQREINEELDFFSSYESEVEELLNYVKNEIQNENHVSAYNEFKKQMKKIGENCEMSYMVRQMKK